MKFAKKTIAKSEISTASIPDIVFLLLFFFMVSATMKQPDDRVKIKTPVAHALTKVQKQFLIKELHVGRPKDPTLGIGFRISAENKIIQISEIGQWVETQRSTLDEIHKNQLIVLLKADENVDMGLITDIQQELRKHNARKFCFEHWKNSTVTKWAINTFSNQLIKKSTAQQKTVHSLPSIYHHARRL